MRCSIHGCPMAVPAEPAAPAQALRAASLGRHLRASLAGALRDPFATAGLAIYAFFVLIALTADRLAGFDPTEILFQANGRLAANLRPGGTYLLGTTNLGRDIFSQL